MIKLNKKQKYTKLYCFIAMIDHFYCNDCENSTYRYCQLCHNILCFNCEHACECETQLSRTSGYVDNNICSIKTCNIFFAKCNDCQRNFCSYCDYIFYCNICNHYYCNDCREFRDCNTCKEFHCQSCETMIHCNECGLDNCVFCTASMVCEYCFFGICNNCSLNNQNISRRIYKCSVCMDMKCTSCSDLEICGYCYEVICKECSLYCGDKCNGSGVHCTLCVSSDLGCQKCKTKTCLDCDKICNLCEKILCIDCFDNEKMDICKSCFWNDFKYSKNILTYNFPIEIIDLIGVFYLS